MTTLRVESRTAEQISQVSRCRSMSARKRRVHLAVDVGGDVLPDVFAVDPHARPPNQPLRLGANPFSCGARSRCSSARARCSRTLTAAFADAERGRGLADIHFFDVSEQHDVTVNLRQTVDGLAQNGAQLLLFQRLGRESRANW